MMRRGDGPHPRLRRRPLPRAGEAKNISGRRRC
jgi:hypothetical protein